MAKKKKPLKARRKTRPVVDASDLFCEHHNLHVEYQSHWVTDKETGKKSYGGEFYRCPLYWIRDEKDMSMCNYYVSGDMRVPIGKVYPNGPAQNK